MSELQRLLALLDELRHRLVRVLWVLVPLFGFMLTCEILTRRVPGIPFPVPYPWPSLFHNVTAQVFVWLQGYELPHNVQVLNIGVADPIVAQMNIALFLTLSLGMPWIVHEAGAFLSPALRHNERALLRNVGLPASLLFAVGFFIGLFVITPFTYRILFIYVAAMGLPATISVQSFLTFTLLYSLAFGVVFELPVFVYALTRMGLVKASFWRKHWRAAVMGCLVFGMVITPDNSGITMLLIATPMMALYAGGVLFAERWERRRATGPAPPLPATLKGGTA